MDGLIFEQAFRYLPEILSGRSFPTQEHEGGIVSAFAMAVLQELNARNATNPLSMIQCERLFRPKHASWPTSDPTHEPRYLRADMCVNLHSLNQGSAAMSAYGWRHENWLEAKFFRAFHEQTRLPKKNDNQSKLTASLLVDLVRILCLCPRSVPNKIDKNSTIPKKSSTGRYLLHVYSGKISQHLSMKTASRPRSWVDVLCLAGEHQLPKFRLGSEISTIRKEVGTGLDNIELQLETTNMLIEPIEKNPNFVTYTCILTRIDAFTVHLNNDYWGLSSDRIIQCSSNDDSRIHKKISEYVAANIKQTKNIDEVKPSKTELLISRENDDPTND